MIPQFKHKRLPETATKYIFITDIQWACDTDNLPVSVTVVATLGQVRKIVDDWESISNMISDKVGCQVMDYSADILNREPEEKSDLVIDIRK